MCGNCEICDAPAVTVPGPVTPAASQVTAQAATPSKVYKGEELDALLNLKHRFKNGIYTRHGHLRVPPGMAGVLLIGREWKVPHTFHVSKGNLLLWDKSNGFRLITGPYSEQSPAGTQRVGFVLDEFEGCNIVKCAATDVAQAEEELLVPFVEPPGLSDQLTKLLGL